MEGVWSDFIQKLFSEVLNLSQTYSGNFNEGVSVYKVRKQNTNLLDSDYHVYLILPIKYSTKMSVKYIYILIATNNYEIQK